MFIINEKKPPDRLVAMPGGFISRKGEGEPGVKTKLAGIAAGDGLLRWVLLREGGLIRCKLCVMQ